MGDQDSVKTACQQALVKVDNGGDGVNEPTLSRDFLMAHQKFVAEFDEIIDADLFQGEKLEKIAGKFLNEHKNYIKAFPFFVKNTNFPRNSNNTNELLQEDVRILAGKEENADTNCLVPKEVPEYAKALGAIYQRACQAAYLRATFNKARNNLEDDRRELVSFARHAIRYDPSSFHACYWYMIAIGWQIDGASNPKDRTVGSTAFHRAILRCIELNPEDSLAHNLLGRYYYNVAALGWLERTVANNLLGGKLEGTYEQAEESFRRSHQLKDDWLPNGLWMARALNAQKRPLSEVKKWIDFGLKMDCKEPTTIIERKELLELQFKLKLSN